MLSHPVFHPGSRAVRLTGVLRPFSLRKMPTCYTFKKVEAGFAGQSSRDALTGSLQTSLRSLHS